MENIFRRMHTTCLTTHRCDQRLCGLTLIFVIYHFVIHRGNNWLAFTSTQRKMGPFLKARPKLLELLQGSVYDEARGLYIPFSDHVDLYRKKPVHSKASRGSSSAFTKEPGKFQFFGNALLIPPDPMQITSPTLRVTNAGFLAITLEMDCDGLQAFEQNLAWTRGKNEDFSLSDFGRVDEKLSQLSEYRGFSIVYSGRRSFHFHFLFSTAHLEKCPHEAPAAERLARIGEEASLLARVHEEYWDHVSSVFAETVGPTNFDRKLRSVSQWRRTPWAIRTLDKPFEALGLSVGSRIPQIVIHENIRSRAAKNAKSFIVPPTFSSYHPTARKRPRNVDSGVQGVLENCDVDEMLFDLQDQCQLEWGEYPRPVEIGTQNGEWIFHFQNHEGDAKPSTFVYGDYRKLQINGRSDFKREFFLPDNLSAQEMGNYLAQKYGAQLPTGPASAKSAAGDEGQITPTRGFQAYKNRVRKPPLVQYAEGWAARFPEPIIEDKNQLKLRYRRKLPHLIVEARSFPLPMLIRSAEGIGKSSALRGILWGEALDYALGNIDSKPKFVAFAYRSRKQAKQKAAEFSEDKFPTVVIMPFWEHLNEICDELGEDRIDREEFESQLESRELCEILSEIWAWNPQVYAELERRRKAIWSEYPFSVTTLIAMTHKAAQLWPHNANMRAWHHPDFDPDGDQAQVEVLSKEFDLLAVVFDDPEVDDFVDIIPDHLYSQLKSLQGDNPNWRNIRRRERQEIYRHVRSDLPFKSFYEFDAHMRKDLDALTAYKVDCELYPYGQDNPQAEKKLYMDEAGKTFYIGPQSWLSDPSRNKCTFLTTEKLVTDVIQRCFEAKKQEWYRPVVASASRRYAGRLPNQNTGVSRQSSGGAKG